MQRGELGRAEDGRLRHEMFPEKIGVLDHGALERLENDAALLQLLGNDVALINGRSRKSRSIVDRRKTTRGRDFIEPARLLENRFAIFVR